MPDPIQPRLRIDVTFEGAEAYLDGEPLAAICVLASAPPQHDLLLATATLAAAALSLPPRPPEDVPPPEDAL